MLYRVNLKKNLFLSLLNLLVLSLGFAFFIISFLYLRFEYSFDNFHSNYNDIYRLTMHWHDDGKYEKTAGVHSPAFDFLKNDLSEETKIARVYSISGYLQGKYDKIKEDNILFVDSDFFKIFDFTQKQIQLGTPFNAVLTKKFALKYFGRTDNVIGNEIIYNNGKDDYRVQITNLIEEIPENSHIEGDIFISFNTLKTTMPRINSWHYPQMFLYILSLNNDFDVDKLLQAHLPNYLKKQNRKYQLQKLSDIHLDNSFSDDWNRITDIKIIYALIATSLIVLFITVINYCNLLTAISLKRLKEFFVKECVGAMKFQLYKQILFESFTLTFLSFSLAIIIAIVILKTFSLQIFGVSLNDLLSSEIKFYINAFGIILLLITFISLLPSFLILKNVNTDKTFSMKSSYVMKVLVGLQFMISGGLLFYALVLNQQINFIDKQSLDYNKNLIVVALEDEYSQNNYKALKEQTLKNPLFESATLTSSVPHNDRFYGQPIQIGPNGEEHTFNTLSSDEHCLETFGLELVSGKDFSQVSPARFRNVFLLNESAVNELGIEPIGETVNLSYYTDQEEKVAGEVIGVVKDFKYNTMFKEIEPLILYYNTHPYYSDFLTFKYTENRTEDAIKSLKSEWLKFNPNVPINLQFLDDIISNSYDYERRLNSIIAIFSFVAIILSFLGIFGISNYDIKTRIKEICIRKVLGAEFINLLLLYTKKLLSIVLICTVFILPIAYYLCSIWLTRFAYKINIGIVIFIIVVLFNVIMGFVSITLSLFKTLSIKEVEGLKEL